MMKLLPGLLLAVLTLAAVACAPFPHATVTVTDRAGRPVEGFPVRFELSEGLDGYEGLPMVARKANDGEG